MSRNIMPGLLVILLFVSTAWGVLNNTESKALLDGNVKNVNLANLKGNEPLMQTVAFAPNSDVTFKIFGIPGNVSFIIFQIHTYQYNITLSYDKIEFEKVTSKSVFGSNVGLFVDTTSIKTTQMFVQNNNVREVNAMLVVTGYNDKAPVPGGCNMEFGTEIAPYEKILVKDAVVIVDAQPASAPLSGGVSPLCDKSRVQHEMYHMYLSEQNFDPNTYFSAITSMLTVEDIMQNGQKILAPFGAPPMRRVFSAYKGIGSVYVVVAKYNNHSSAYVPTFSYACNPVLYPESCELLHGTFDKLLCAAVFFVGFFSVFFGHKCIEFDMLLPIFFMGAVAGYIIDANIAVALGFGFIAAFLWGILTSVLEMTALTSLVFSLAPGLFFSCLAYFRAPDTFIILENDFVFWMLFITVALAVSLVVAVLRTFSLVLTCAIFGSFMMILSIDYYAGSSLKYIMINVIRRATVPEFGLAIVQPPYQAADIGLTWLWIALIVFRIFRPWFPFALTSSGETPRFFVSERTPLVNSRFIGRVNIRSYP